MFPLDTFTPTKKDLPVLILGSYSVPCYDRLVKLKDELRKCNYDRASLVADFPDTPELQKLSASNYPLYAYRKSVIVIEQSKVNLFIFFKDCPFGSVISEMIISVLKFGQFTCSSFMFQVGINFDSVPRGFLSEYQLNVRHFTDLDDLIIKAKRECQIHIIENDCHAEQPVLGSLFR